MLQKIIQLFLKREPSKDNVITPSDEGISVKLFHTAEELKKIGDQYFKNRNFAQAENYYNQSLEIDPNQFEVYKNLGVIQYYLGKLEDALRYYDQALMLKSDYPEAHSNRGLALNDLNRLDEALISLDRAIALKPDFAFAYNNRGIALKNLNRLDEALESYDHAIALNANYAEAYNNRGSVLSRLGKLDEALVNYDHAIELKLDYADAYCNRGSALNDQNLPEEALISINRAIMLKPDFAMAHNNRGIALRNLNKLDEALDSYNRAIALKPDLAEAYCNQGSVFYSLMKLDEALVYYDRAIALKPDFAEAYNNQGAALADLHRLEDALVAYDLAIKFAPDNEFFIGSRFDVKLKLCDWSDYAEHRMHLEKKAQAGKNDAHPFAVLAVSGMPDLQKLAAEAFVHKHFPINNDLAPISRYPKHDKIRIAYFSADFRNHPVAFLTAGLFERHDKSKFELIAFSLSGSDDEMRKRIKPAFDQFIDVSKYSDREVALLARDMEIDIAIDLGGFTSHCRPSIFALRAAPVQINYIGYPGTMGADYMDYIIADKTIVPCTHQKFYSEKIVYLPSFQSNDTKRVISDRKFTREELGLPATGFVFCCLNNNYKINPRMFDCWMRILKHVNGSVLWLIGENQGTVSNLLKEAAFRGVDCGRLIFAKRLPVSEYLARYRMADLFLDTLPFNAGTTASDALWAGLPVLTLIGESFAGRMAASLLNAIHLPELISTTQEEYEACAINLATHPEKLKSIRQKLANNRLTTPLFDTEYFTKNIESAYIQMYERYQAGLEPDHINA